MPWRTIMVWFGVASAGASTGSAQDAPAGWAFGAAGFDVSWQDDYGSLDRLAGPALQASYLAPRKVGFDARVGYFTDTGFHDAHGLSAIAGITYGIPAGRHLFQLKGGGTAFFGGNNDGGQLLGGGPYGGAGMTFRVAGRFGIQVEALGRAYRTSEGWSLAPSGAAALLLLPR